MTRLTIAIDGPAGSGKSTVARRVAAMMGYLYLDSGAMYRAVALKALEKNIAMDDEAKLEAINFGNSYRAEVAYRSTGSRRTEEQGVSGWPRSYPRNPSGRRCPGSIAAGDCGWSAQSACG